MFEECRFVTSRLQVANWHNRWTDTDRAEIVLDLLRPGNSEWLPHGWQGIRSVEQATSWIVELENDDTIVLVATECSSSEPVGILILSEPIDGDGTVRIGYLVSPKRQGEGFATELVAGFADWARSAQQIETIFAGVSADHMASRSVLEKAGFDVVQPENQDALDLEYQLEL